MLILSRKSGEAIVMGSNAEIVIKILQVHGDRVRIGIDADKSIAVHREEVYARILNNPEITEP